MRESVISGSSGVRLFCLPYSGASATIYARWGRRLPTTIAVRPIELPGRGSRIAEPLVTDPHRLAGALADEVQSSIAGADVRPYALFGHSLGALLVFELAHALRERSLPPPLVLFASGTEAPSVRDDSEFRRPRSDAELIADLRGYRGTPEEAIADAELMALMLPILRADFLMCGAYAYRRRPPLACPITVLGGFADDVAQGDLEAWGRETRSGFDLAMFEGDHFFIHTQQPQVLDLVAARITALMRVGDAA